MAAHPIGHGLPPGQLHVLRALQSIADVAHPVGRLGGQHTGFGLAPVQPGERKRIGSAAGFVAEQVQGVIGGHFLHAGQEGLRVGGAVVLQPEGRQDAVRAQAVGQHLDHLSRHLGGVYLVAAFPQGFGQQQAQVVTLRVCFEGVLQLDHRFFVQVALHVAAGQRAPRQLELAVFAFLVLDVQAAQFILNGSVVGVLLEGPLHMPDGARPGAAVLVDLAHAGVRVHVVRYGAEDPQEDIAGFRKAGFVQQ